MAEGEVYPSKNYGDMEVVEYVSAIKVLIRFVNTDYTKYAEASNIRKGEVKDITAPSVCGVGYVGIGSYASDHFSYKRWNNMLERCYGPGHEVKFPHYIGCTVVPEWHNFQVFAAWFDDNYVEGYELDKDIKVPGNRVYGPDTCIFVTQAENMVEAAAKSYTMLFMGEDIIVYNLSEFCRNKGLNYQKVYYALTKRKNPIDIFTCV